LPFEGLNPGLLICPAPIALQQILWLLHHILQSVGDEGGKKV
jgi:hypothetical protein